MCCDVDQESAVEGGRRGLGGRGEKITCLFLFFLGGGGGTGTRVRLSGEWVSGGLQAGFSQWKSQEEQREREIEYDRVEKVLDWWQTYV